MRADWSRDTDWPAVDISPHTGGPQAPGGTEETRGQGVQEDRQQSRGNSPHSPQWSNLGGEAT